MSSLGDGRWLMYFPFLPEEMCMAEAKGVLVTDALERQWIVCALQLQRASLLRGRAKEITGSEIFVLRGKEIEFISALIRRFE